MGTAATSSTGSTAAMSSTPSTEASWKLAGDAWGHAAPDWAYRFEPYANDAVESVFDRLGLSEGTRLVDIACGAGNAAQRATRRGAELAGLDASEALIDIARRRAPDADLRIGDMFDLPWADSTFDAAISINGVWGGCQGALDEARRVLRTGAGIGLTFWGPGKSLDLRDFFIALGTSTPSMGDEMIGLASIGTPGVVEEMLTTAGFASIERWGCSSVLEIPDADAAWRTVRSPGLVVPALDHLGEDELRSRLLPTLEPFRADDGSYRIVNELTCVTATAV